MDVDNEQVDKLLLAIKTRLRISHNKLDNEINETLKTGRNELVRVGVNTNKAFSDDSLIENALKVWCQMNFTDDTTKYDMFSKSWQYQIDNLRKSQGYRKDDNNV